MVKEAILTELIEEFEEPRAEFDGKRYVTGKGKWLNTPMERARPLLDQQSLGVLTIDDSQKIYREMALDESQLYPNL